MMLPSRGFERYHAHVYFDETSLEKATSLREPIANKFNIELGRVHTKPVGPHPCWSYQILFSHDEFDEIIAWLDAHRQGLTVLLHPEAGSFVIDHTERAGWLGEPVELNLS
ncbi:DOPA 4,5-dioxygenase family protein [Vibrio breoganii]|uniref:4,5-dioxygenase n=1 Tax=Vibrio breoganii TaxID=553239 RepID=A0AAN0XUZ7_9VIBR|nr:DOPA 4,5-dioxygenase family protein [Vibrio breoganii]ANO33086.1 4,5-dioxygenase [Vibrio breoganii]PMG38017.1 4,5-dioxygenase [Vibrio breoganii]PMG82934.1 4,5-dioxygenase [Vibrio breoganii]PMK41912.1 4,5-dioxygenase [Vibrio breoganii]PMO29403.1 4,5-dioxygenase [Vibrio breoganii]